MSGLVVNQTQTNERKTDGTCAVRGLYHGKYITYMRFAVSPDTNNQQTHEDQPPARLITDADIFFLNQRFSI